MDLVPREYKQNNFLNQTEPNKGGFSAVGLKDKIAVEKSIKIFALLGFLILVLLILGWGGLKLYQIKLQKDIASLKDAYGQFFSQEEKAQAEKIVDWQSRLTVLTDLWKSHTYGSNVLASLGAATLPKVQWQSFDLDVANRKVSLKGLAGNYETIAKQILAFQEEKFSKIKVADIKLDKTGGVSFSVTFEFSAKLLQVE